MPRHSKAGQSHSSTQWPKLFAQTQIHGRDFVQ
jgi:hypothetical protein